MLTVILSILIIAAIIFAILAYNAYDNVGFIVITMICIVFSIVVGGLVVDKWCNVATEHAIEQKITMYEEENAEIESKIDAIVKEYMAHEKETFKEFSPDAGDETMTMISLFPELNSDDLVQQQINTYNKNAQKIKELKEDKINLSRDKWMLYFGH